MLIKKSPAKINLYLEIIGKTSNGYHLLDSLMVLIGIFDIVTFERSSNLQLKVVGEDASILQKNWQDNIIIKATQLLAKKYHFVPNLKITLEKNIPIAAGLGGGSSNAAAALLMLNEFYNLNLSKAELLDFGLQLGADVPFFINGKAAFVSGIGEILKPAEFNFGDLFLLIINPKKPLITKEVFSNFSEFFLGDIASKQNQEKSENTMTIKNNICEGEIISFIKNRGNDLQIPAIKMLPEISLILQEISNQKNCLISRMSGSGASCFGIFSSQKDAILAKENLLKILPNFYINCAKII